MLRLEDYSGTSHVYRRMYILSAFLLLMFHSSTGYIINEDGQLVPFKIYKKAGSRVMCFLHPRNCRGGYHKRLAGEASPRLTNMYELQVLKRKLTKEEKPPSRPHDYGSTENDFDAQYPAEIESKPPVLTDSLELLDKYNKNMLATKYASNEIRTVNKPRSQRKRAIDDSATVFGKADYHNLGDRNALQRNSDYNRGHYGMQKRPIRAAEELSAMLSKYPAYKRLMETRLLPLPSLHTDDDTTDMFYPIDDTDIYSMTSSS